VDNIQRSNHYLKSATLTMFLISLLFFWIPVFGAFAAGYSGGKKARSINTALLALLIPSTVFGFFLFALAPNLEALPVFGIVARQGGFYLPLIYLVSIISGAWFGVTLGKKI